MTEPEVRLTQYSHGAGCGCKIAPAVLTEMLKSSLELPLDEKLIVGNESRDDAAVYQVSEDLGIVSTTDFFMPIVDDPTAFGRIAATNAISDIYAMGATPIMAIAILGWPVEKLSADVARQVLDGGRMTCAEAGISLGGGHSIDAPEPIFGLAVTGVVNPAQLKRNNQARSGDCLYLTKPLGVGVLATAQKQGLLTADHEHVLVETMCRLNKVGAALAKLPEVSAITDVTGFGLAGHLLEICEGSGLAARLNTELPVLLPGFDDYLQQGCVPGGSGRNFASFGHQLESLSDYQRAVLCDPQTSGGLLIAAQPNSQVQEVLDAHGLCSKAIGALENSDSEKLIRIA